MSQKLPQDLQKYIRSRILKRLSVLIILIAAIGTLLFFLGDRIFDFENTGLKILCYAVTLLIPFWLSGVPAKLIDSTWSGKIVDINTELTTGSESSVKPSQETLYTQRNVYLTVVTPDGRTVRRRVYSGRDDTSSLWHIGDTVFHLYGTDQTVVIPRGAAASVSCPVCGRSCDVNDVRCTGCDHTLIKNVDTE